MTGEEKDTVRKRQGKWFSLMIAATLAFSSVGLAWSPPMYAAEHSTPLKVEWQTPLGEGTTLYKYTKMYDGETTVIYTTVVDLNNAYVQVKPIYGTNEKLTDKQTVTQMAKETGAVAAINADFFNMTKLGAPFGIVVKDKEIVSSMGDISYWYSLGITTDKLAQIEHFGFSGQVTASNGQSFPLRGINKEEYNPSQGKSHLNQLNMYTPKFGKTSLGKLDGYDPVVEIVFVDNVASEIRVNQPGATIPSNGFVLWGHGDAATFLLNNVQLGSQVAIDASLLPLDREWEQAVGGNVLLVDEGKALTSFKVDTYLLAENARTAVGVSQDGKKLYLVTVDKGSHSRGVTLLELAQLMVEIGAYRAVNFDGGGSTTLAARMLGDTQPKLINLPKGGSERAVPTGLAIYNTAPQGTLANFRIEGAPSEVLIGQPVTFPTKAYDTHYLPYQIKPEEITWEVAEPDMGSFQGGRFIAKKAGTATILAKTKVAVKSVKVTVLGGKDLADLSISPGEVRLPQNKSVQLAVKLKTKKGTWINAPFSSLKISSDSPLVTVNNKLEAVTGNQSGRATLTVSYDGFVRTVPVRVGEHEEPWLTFDRLENMHHWSYPESIKGDGAFTVVEGEYEPIYRTKRAAMLRYNFSNAPQTDVRIAYGRLDANPLTMPGQPFGMGVWVYGDASNHWLRAEVIDASGKLHFITLADKIDWKGWKQVKAYFPFHLPYPLQLRSLYVVNRVEGAATRPLSGTVYFDEVSLLQPYDSAKVLPKVDVVPGTPAKLSLGKELNLSISLDNAKAFLEKARVEPKSVIPQAMAGFVPADYGFVFQAVSIKPGTSDQLASRPVSVTLTPKQWSKGTGVGLLYFDAATKQLEVIKGKVDLNRNWTYQLKKYGTYYPYYLEMPEDMPFMDVLDHPNRNEIQSMYMRGYVKGIEPDLFGPELSLTRAQYVVLLSRIMGWELPQETKLTFKDQIPEYARAAVQAAVSRGIIKGYEDNTFRPNQAITRTEAAVLLDRLLPTDWKPAPSAATWADEKDWPKWARTAIQRTLAAGLIDSAGNRFEPNKPTTRAVCVVALYRFLELKL